MKVAVVGAGPAGVRAVEVLVAAGIAPVWIDEAPDGGGRIYQRPPPGLARDARTLYGFEAARAAALHATLDTLKPRVDWRAETIAWHLRPGAHSLHLQRPGRHETLDYDAVILCTGAIDRVIPIPGWTLPGVTTLGGAQIALKSQGCAIGASVAFVGTGPLLWLVAYQYASAGARVAAVLDTTPFATKARAAAGLARGGATFAKGLWYTAWLRARGVQIAEGVAALAIEGGAQGVTGMRWLDASGREQHVGCDAAAIGWGLRPEAQLADLAGVPFVHDEVQHDWIPQRDAAGRTPVPGIYLAGDGARIAGAAVAELAGARAALALLEDAGSGHDAGRAAALDRALARQARFRLALDRAFPFPAALARAIADDTVLCRCEGLRAGELRATVRADAVPRASADLNRAKSFSRVGMGRCQGRLCGAAAAELLAATLGTDSASIGRLRGQPPVKPISFLDAGGAS